MQNANKTRGTAVLGGAGMVGLWGASSLIRSVQRGTFSNGTSMTGSTTVAAVIPANSVVICLGFSSNNSGSSQGGDLPAWSGYITGPTTISWSRTNGHGVTATTSWELWEFQPGVLRSAQYVSLSSGSGASGTATITAVNTAKAMLIPEGWMTNQTSYTDDVTYSRVDLTNSTTVTITRNTASSNTVTVGYCGVIEFF